MIREGDYKSQKRFKNQCADEKIPWKHTRMLDPDQKRYITMPLRSSAEYETKIVFKPDANFKNIINTFDNILILMQIFHQKNKYTKKQLKSGRNWNLFVHLERKRQNAGNLNIKKSLVYIELNAWFTG
jgi:hypothetical protein